MTVILGNQHDSHSEQSEESTDTTALEQKIDILACKLYGLTDKEIAIVEKSNLHSIPVANLLCGYRLHFCANSVT